MIFNIITAIAAVVVFWQLTNLLQWMMDKPKSVVISNCPGRRCEICKTHHERSKS
jgi:hypothetical protein